MAMAEPLLSLDLFLRGLAAGGAGAVAIALARQGPDRHARVAGAAFGATIITYLINASPQLQAAMGWAITPIWLVSVMGTGFVWLFLGVLFEDWRIGPRTLAPAGILLTIGVIGRIASPELRPSVWLVHNLLQVGFATHALLLIIRSWRDDLVPSRRRLRGPMMAAAVVMVLAVSFFQIGETLGVRPGWSGIASAVAIAALSMAGAAALLTLKEGLFGRAPTAGATMEASASPPAEDDAQDRIIAGRLATAMDQDALWRREGLTIGMLAEALGAPEHRVRRVINGYLGHRNFAAFVNTHRIAAAKAALAAPDNATRTVAAIAFDLGFGSLGPFNRAFKEATGLTPTEFRQQSLGSSSPNSEKTA
jgi:AraC-like DNA-binding protein